MEVANRGAAPRRAEKPSPGKATVEREQGRPLTEMSPAPLPILDAKDSALEPRKADAEVLADVKSGAPWGSDRNPTRPAFPAYEKAAPNFIDAEPLSRNVVGEAVGEFVTGVFIVAILCPVIWAFCLLIRYLGARWGL